MTSNHSKLVLAAVMLVVAGAFLVRGAGTADPPAASDDAATSPTATAPALVELGSDRCASCKAMVPVLDELRTTHDCALEVEFIDVWDDPDEGERFDVTMIPTQVLLAPDGKEISRHTGFWSADSIRAAFAENGYALADAGSCDP